MDKQQVVKAFLSPGGQFADLTNEIGVKAGALTASHEAGARFLALPIENTRDAATWILASFHSRIAVVPLPPALPIPALEARLAQLPAGQVIFPGSLSLVKPDGAPPSLKPLKDIWCVIFSSGSSGEPKGIALTGVALRASALAHAEHTGAGNACWLLDLPLYHVGGLSILSRALFLGSPLALGAPRFDAATTAAWIQSGIVQGLSLVPTTLFRLLKETGLDFSPLQLILLGGAPASAELVAQAKARQAPVLLTYGMTEHASQIATEKKPGTGLEPLPQVELRTAADGELLVRSPMLASGIFQRGQLCALPSLDGFFPTGDFAELRGKQLRLMGRKSELIISGGMKIFPLEVETELARLPGVRDCAVTSLPDAEWGEVLCALVVEESAGSFDRALARESLVGNLEARKIPRRWTMVDKIPRSATGKILRAELRALISGT